MSRPRSFPTVLPAIVLAGLVCSASRLVAQEKKEASHVERFASPRAKLQRTERVATRKLTRNPRDARALGERGLARLRLGEAGAGIEDLRRAAALDPKSADARADLAYALWITGDLKDALGTARSAVELGPNHAAAHYYLARLLVETGARPNEALENFQRAVDLNPLETGYRYDLFNAYLQQGDLPHAAAELRLLRLVLPPDNAQLLYAQGLFEANVGDLAIATADFRKTLEKNPRLNPARLDLGVALSKQGAWKEAEEVLSALSVDMPQSYPGAYFHALALQNLHRAAEAEQETRRALTLEPDSAEARTLLGIVLSEKRDFTGAIAVLEEAIKLDPSSFDAQFYVGRATFAQNDLQRARDAFRAASLLHPGDPEAHFFLATALEGLGDTEGAKAEYSALTVSFPQDARGYIGLGNLLAKEGRLEPAAAALGRARELDPQNFEAILDFGRILIRPGKFNEAIDALRGALERAPESADAHYQPGLALRRAGREEEAGAQFVIVDRLNKLYRTGERPTPER